MAPTKILLIPLSERGQLNVSLAAASSLVSRTDVEVHLAAFAEVGPRIDDLRQQATARDAYRSPITFHPLPGPSMAEAALRSGQLTRDAIMHGLGRKEVKRASNNFMAILSPWTKEEYEAIFKSCLRVIEETEPDLVVLDAIFAPALDALKATQTPRRQVYLSPNSLKDNLGAAVRFWQFPALGSGYTYPLPWLSVPRNFYFFVLPVTVLPFSASMKQATAIRTSLGLPGPWPTFVRDPKIPTICMSTPECEFPLTVPPANRPFLCGPILLDAPPVSSVDPELAAWLAKAPTVLICLGSHIVMDDLYAGEMAAGLRTLFDQRPDVQVLWKVNRAGLPAELGASVLAPVKEEIQQGRLRTVTWLAPDPLALLETGHIVCVVSHGGSNSYHEAVWTGVPQILLPAWFDCYDFAARVEYLGIGVWANRTAAPRVAGAELGRALLTVVGESGQGGCKRAGEMKSKAEALREQVRKYGGREKAVDILLELARKPHGETCALGTK